MRTSQQENWGCTLHIRSSECHSLLLREVFFLFFFLIYLHFYFQLIDEFTDVNDGEKELMKLWNLHLMKNRLVFVLSVW